MRNEKEIQKQLAEMLYQARLRSGMSISAVAEAIGKDDKTYSNWERGKSAPTVPMVIKCFEAMGEPLFKPILSTLYPEEFTFDRKRDPSERRESLKKYIDLIASDKEIEDLHYLILGDHGSSWRHQIEGFVALDHLPMYARVLVAQIIVTNYELLETRGQLLNTDYAMPDLSLYREGLGMGYDAATNNYNKYTETRK